MGLIVVGINHKSAPLGIREQLAFDASEIPVALRRLREVRPKAEFVVLSTCNRVEVYCASEEALGPTGDWLVDFLSDFHGVESGQLKPFAYCHENEDAVRHLLLVSAGMDSLVVGEAQILGQVKESYRVACAAKGTGKILNRLFHCAFSTAKSVHTTTSISSGRVSVAGVAVQLATQLFADIARARVLVIGAGETGTLVVQHLQKMGCADITVVNRSHERGVALARRRQIHAGRWEELSERLGRADIVISSVATQEYLYSKMSFEGAVARRRRGSLLIIDFGVPRNFEPAVDEIDGVYLYSVDELKDVAEENLKTREADLASGIEIVYDNAADFMAWYHAKDIGPLIGRMKAEFGRVGRRELDRFFVGPRHEASCRAVMEEMVDRVVNKLLHCVIQNVNVVANETGPTEAAKLVDTILREARELACAPDRKADTEAPGQP
jgi:glutamyl-tRNA reductase